MAIQIPNPGTGNGATGDNEFVLWSKVKDNFSDQTNAASKLVGATTGRVPTSDDVFEAYNHLGSSTVLPDLNDYYPDGVQTPIKSAKVIITINESIANKPVNDTGRFEHMAKNLFAVQHFYGSRSTNIQVRTKAYMGGNVWTPWGYYYTSTNTTKDSNGFIKGASPIVKVFADKVELNGDAENQNVTYKKNGIGDYTITTVSGISTDGWYIELPKDMNGNPKVAVTLTEVDGVISLKTYKRIFSMETFTFEPDLDNPLDIPDTRWIDLRLNEIPFEVQEELPTDGG